MNSDDKRRAAIGLRIRRERIIWNLTQEELSRILGISPNYLGQIERGTRELSRKMEDRLCETFNLTREEFYHGKPHRSWVSMTAESGVIFHDLTEDDIGRLLHSCTPEELQFFGHLIRCVLHYLHNPATRGQLLPSFSEEDLPPEEEEESTTYPVG